jgi:hypothetical protein
MGPRCTFRGTSQISTLESSDEGGAVRWWLELPASCIHEGGGAVRLEGEVNHDLPNVEKIATCIRWKQLDINYLDINFRWKQKIIANPEINSTW